MPEIPGLTLHIGCSDVPQHGFAMLVFGLLQNPASLVLVARES